MTAEPDILTTLSERFARAKSEACLRVVRRNLESSVIDAEAIP